MVINLAVSIGLIKIVRNVKEDPVLNFYGVMLIPFTFLSIVFYLMAAYTNPGLLIGNEQV